jgi:hypothetical protein
MALELTYRIFYEYARNFGSYQINEISAEQKE